MSERLGRGEDCRGDQGRASKHGERTEQVYREGLAIAAVAETAFAVVVSGAA